MTGDQDNRIAALEWQIKFLAQAAMMACPAFLGVLRANVDRFEAAHNGQTTLALWAVEEMLSELEQQAAEDS